MVHGILFMFTVRTKVPTYAPSTESTEELTGPSVELTVTAGNTRSLFTYLYFFLDRD